MAATYQWMEDSGPVGSKVTSSGTTNVNWMNLAGYDSSGTTYQANPIQAGQNSFTKYIYVNFNGGTYNQISNGQFSHFTGTSALPTGVTMYGKVAGTYAQPATTSISGSSTDISTYPSSNIATNFSTTAPTGTATATLSSSATGYSQYFVTQLVTTSSAPSGDIPQQTLSLTYDEQ
jgi:hypothetical protein